MIYIDMHKCLDSISDYGPGHNYRTEDEEYERTVVYGTLLFHNSCFLRMLEEKLSLNLLQTFFVVQCRSIIIAVFHNCVFSPYFLHLPILFYNCVVSIQEDRKAPFCLMIVGSFLLPPGYLAYVAMEKHIFLKVNYHY